MATETKVEAKTREVSGKGAAGRLRREGIVPAVVYGEGKEACPLELNAHDFELLLRHHAGESLVLDLSIDGKATKKVLLRDVQHHPLTDGVLHADFVEISMTKKMRVSIPLNFAGEPVGVTQDGGVLDLLLREVEIECLPADIVEEITVDVSGLNIGDSLQVADIQASLGFEIVTDPDIAVASVAAPRIEEEEVEEEVEEGSDGEPEVIGKKEEEGTPEGE